MKLSKLNIKKINLEDVEKDYSAQDILLKIGELYQFESGIYGYGNIWTKFEKNIENIYIYEDRKLEIVFKYQDKYEELIKYLKSRKIMI